MNRLDTESTESQVCPECGYPSHAGHLSNCSFAAGDQKTSEDSQAEQSATENVTNEPEKNKAPELKELFQLRKNGMARVFEDISNAVVQNPNITQPEADAILAKISEQFKFTPQHNQIASEALETFFRKKAALNFAMKKYSQPEAFFEAALGKKPKGSIILERGPIVTHIVSDSRQDLAYTPDAELQGKRALGKIIIRAKALVRARSLNGRLLKELRLPELDGMVTIEYRGNDSPARTDQHEEQHAIYNFFKKNFNENTFAEQLVSLDLTSEQIERIFLDYFSDFIDDSAKDEILAHFADGSDRREVIIAIRDVYYSYITSHLGGEGEAVLEKTLDKMQKAGIPREQIDIRRRQLQEAIKQASRTAVTKEYKIKKLRRIYDAIDIYSKFYSEKEQSKKKITGLFINEELRKWPKVGKRLGKIPRKLMPLR